MSAANTHAHARDRDRAPDRSHTKAAKVATEESLAGKYVRLPWSRSWTKILGEKNGHIRVRSSRGKNWAIWIPVAPELEIRDKKGAAL